MIWSVLIGALAAFGLLCALWVCLGGMLTRVGTVAILCDGREESLVRRYRWLRELGLTRCRMVLLNSHLPLTRQQQIERKCGDILFCSLEQWQAHHGKERETFD